MATRMIVTATAVRLSQRGLSLLRESRTSLRYRTADGCGRRPVQYAPVPPSTVRTVLIAISRSPLMDQFST